MDINELTKMTLPKLRELAKEKTDLQGVLGMKKEEIVAAIAKAEGISYEPAKDVTTINSIKQEIRSLKKRKEEAQASSGEKSRFQVRKIRRKIKRLKRETRLLARKAAAKKTEQAAAAAASPATA